MLGEDDVGVDAAEAEGVDAGDPGAPSAGSHGSASLISAEAGVGEGLVGLVDVEGRRQLAVEDGEGGLGQAGGTGGGHGVADHRLHRAQHRVATRRRARVRSAAEHGAQRLELGAVADRGGGAVRLDQPDGGRVQPAGPPRLLDRQHLTLGPRVHERRAGAVGRNAGPLDHGVDAVAVALGVGHPLEHQDAGALAHQDAVGVAAERPDDCSVGDSARSWQNTLHRVRSWQWWTPPARTTSAAPERSWFTPWSTAMSDERARRIDRVRRAPQVEPVGDARLAARLGTRPIELSGRSGPRRSWNSAFTCARRAWSMSGTSTRRASTSCWAVRTRWSSRATPSPM